MGGFVGEILDGVTHLVEKVGSTITGAVDSVIHNPVGAIVDVGLLSMGVPPIYAGLAAGAANAAANHGDILKGALTGGAMAWAAGSAGEFAGAAGLDPVLGAAASGAAAGATGAALTGQGMQGVIHGALGGGVMGGAIGYYAKQNGSITYTYDDGSTLTRNADGTFSSTPAGSVPAPVIDRSTPQRGAPEGAVNLDNTWNYAHGHPPGAAGDITMTENGQYINVNGGKAVPLDVLRAAAATGKDIWVEGMKVDTSVIDAAKNASGALGNEANIVEQYRTPGTALANAEEINTGKATYNSQAKAWETTAVTDVNQGSVYTPHTNLTSTGVSDSAPGTIYQGANGPEIVLNNGKTVSLHDYETAMASGQPVSVDNQMQTQFRVEMGGSAGFADNPTQVIEQYRTPNSELATQEQIDNGTAKWNAAANAWEVGGTPTQGEITQPIQPTDVAPHGPVVPVDITSNPKLAH